MGKIPSVPLSRDIFYDLVAVHENLYQVTLRPDDALEELELAVQRLRQVVDRLSRQLDALGGQGQ